MRCRKIEETNNKKCLVFFGSKGVSNTNYHVIMKNMKDSTYVEEFDCESFYISFRGVKQKCYYYKNGNQTFNFFVDSKYVNTNFVPDSVSTIIDGDIKTDKAKYNEWYSPNSVDFIIYPKSIKTDNGKSYANGKEGTSQSINQRLTLIQGELQHFMNQGFPLMNGNCNKYMLDSYIINVVSRHPDVTQILMLDSRVVNHNYEAKIIINTKYGELSLKEYQSL